MFKWNTILSTITLVFLLFSNQSFARFVSPDPVGAQAHIQNGNIQGFNRYAYANNNPYKYVDPDGRTSQPFTMMRNQQNISRIKIYNPAFHQQATFAQGLAVMAIAGAVSPVAAMSMEMAAISAGEAPIISNRTRGLASEARVLSDLGLTKNNLKVSTSEGNSIPDALTASLSVEIKDTINVSLTRQLRIQTDAAGASGRKSLLVTGKNTNISRPAERAFNQIIKRDDLGPLR